MNAWLTLWSRKSCSPPGRAAPALVGVGGGGILAIVVVVLAEEEEDDEAADEAVALVLLVFGNMSALGGSH